MRPVLLEKGKGSGLDAREGHGHRSRVSLHVLLKVFDWGIEILGHVQDGSFSIAIGKPLCGLAIRDGPQFCDYLSPVGNFVGNPLFGDLREHCGKMRFRVKDPSFLNLHTN